MAETADRVVASDRIDRAFARLGLLRPEDLLLHLPLRYEDETRLDAIGTLRDGQTAQIEGKVVRRDLRRHGRRMLTVVVADDSGEATLRFLHFRDPQAAQFASGNRVRAIGDVRRGLVGAEMVHPRYRLVRDGTPLPDRLTPVYPTAAGIAQYKLRAAVLDALARLRWSDTVPPDLLADVGLAEFPAMAAALDRIHRPERADDPLLEPAWRRVRFEELLAQQLSLRRSRRVRATQVAHPLPDGARAESLVKALPFRLTAAQRRVWKEIRDDLGRSQPMNRLLQGDVGSGKTVVAALAALQAVGSGRQAALMAPTEILARQHLDKLAPWLEPTGVRIGWLVGALTPAAKRKARATIAAGEVDFVVGTHALIEDAVVFDRLALAIVDEQHRFGVAQRLALRSRGDGTLAHQLMMSATPIPRTLAMTAYADLDVSVIDELPPGRQPVRTRLVLDDRRDEVVDRVRTLAADGGQAYWICPLVEESETLDLQNAVATFEQLQGALAGLRVALIHGRQPADEKSATMAAFGAGEIDLLVATTVIEVGVDVPNATLMVIEHADRFGLSQLHQLRGRVGRGAGSSTCVLLYRKPVSPTAAERLKTLYDTDDGFEIARRDLKLRGPGEFLGARQSGALMLRFADLERDVDLIEAARATADAMLTSHPEAVREHLRRWLGADEAFLAA